MDDSIRRSSDQDDTERKLGQILLVLEIPVHGRQGVDVSGGPAKQLTVGHPGPSLVRNRVRLYAGKLYSEIGGQILIKQNAQSSIPRLWQAQVRQLTARE